jgi:hypothetical protein
MPITNEQNIKILGYAQAGYTTQHVDHTMEQIGDRVSMPTLYKHLARMRRDNGEWSVQKVRLQLVKIKEKWTTIIGSGRQKTARTPAQERRQRSVLDGHAQT